MLTWLAHSLEPFADSLRVFQFVTLRVILAALTSLLFSLVMGPWLIRKLARFQIGQHIRDDGPESHWAKAGTPTMGGVLILAGMAVATLLWADLSSSWVWLVLLVTFAFGVIGFVDDFQKLRRGSSHGLSAAQKYGGQTIVGLAAGLWLYLSADNSIETSVLLPMVKDVAIPLSVGYIVWTYLVVAGASNAVNLTDGLDGLATLPCVLVVAGLGIFAYVTGHFEFANYLGFGFIPGAGELAIFCGALGGAALGFLWFNTYPAQVFMGDVGSLSMGAAIGIVAVCIRQELILVVMGGVFVAETISVILQVGLFKATGRRTFKMAPLHHHFELLGWAEPKIIVRFWIVTLILVLVGLATLKVR